MTVIPVSHFKGERRKKKKATIIYVPSKERVRRTFASKSTNNYTFLKASIISRSDLGRQNDYLWNVSRICVKKCILLLLNKKDILIDCFDRNSFRFPRRSMASCERTVSAAKTLYASTSSPRCARTVKRAVSDISSLKR